MGQLRLREPKGIRTDPPSFISDSIIEEVGVLFFKQRTQVSLRGYSLTCFILIEDTNLSETSVGIYFDSQ